MTKLDHFPRTLHLVQKHWDLAEKMTCKLILDKYAFHDEVFISRIFAGELGSVLKPLCNSLELREAFSNDLRDCFAAEDMQSEIACIANNLIVRLTYHEPHIEKITGGDLGLVMTKPTIEQSGMRKLTRKVSQQGLLCQAKRKKSNGHWGQLTERQEELLPRQIDYLALLLYSYADAQRASLKPFSWKTWKGSSFDDIKQWLKSGNEGNTFTSTEILEALAKGTVGTNDTYTINSKICPSETSFIKLEITWSDWPPQNGPGGGGPNNPSTLWGHIKGQKGSDPLLLQRSAPSPALTPFGRRDLVSSVSPAVACCHPPWGS